MLDHAMKAITLKLNHYMHERFDLDEDVVALTAPIDSEGNAITHVNNKLIVFLTNLNKDTVPGTSGLASGSTNTSQFMSASPLYLNLYIMISACFDDSRYQESLKFLSYAVGCFQEQPIIDKNSNPELPDGIDKLILDIENINIHELSNLWGILGGKYQPSILYKVRMINFVSDAIDHREVKSSVTESSAGNY